MRGVRSQRRSERCERTSEWKSEQLSTYITIPKGSESLCIDLDLGIIIERKQGGLDLGPARKQKDAVDEENDGSIGKEEEEIFKMG